MACCLAEMRAVSKAEWMDGSSAWSTVGWMACSLVEMRAFSKADQMSDYLFAPLRNNHEGFESSVDKVKNKCPFFDKLTHLCSLVGRRSRWTPELRVARLACWLLCTL